MKLALALAFLASVLALAPRAGAAQAPSVAQVLAGCRRSAAHPIAAYRPSELQLTGLSGAVNNGPVVQPDEVLYRAAHAQVVAGDMAAARRTFLNVIRSYPQSPWVPYVYLSFGEYFFGQADMQAAEQFYEKVLEFPSGPASLFALAHYRLGWVRRNLGEETAARDSFVKALGLATTSPNDADVQLTATAVRREICGP